LLRLRGDVARLDPAGDRRAAEADLRAAIIALDEFGALFYAARARLSLAELLVRQSRSGDAQPLLTAAEETFTRLGAGPWLDRVAGVRASTGSVAAGAAAP
jgi:hypothetical protein